MSCPIMHSLSLLSYCIPLYNANISPIKNPLSMRVRRERTSHPAISNTSTTFAWEISGDEALSEACLSTLIFSDTRHRTPLTPWPLSSTSMANIEQRWANGENGVVTTTATYWLAVALSIRHFIQLVSNQQFKLPFNRLFTGSEILTDSTRPHEHKQKNGREIAQLISKTYTTFLIESSSLDGQGTPIDTLPFIIPFPLPSSSFVIGPWWVDGHEASRHRQTVSEIAPVVGSFSAVSDGSGTKVEQCGVLSVRSVVSDDDDLVRYKRCRILKHEIEPWAGTW